MRIKNTDARAQDIDAIYLDGKRITEVVELDDEEGWVKIAKPKIERAVQVLTGPDGKGAVSDESAPSFTWDYEIKKGKVDVTFFEEDEDEPVSKR